ncbi:MAG: hypothetical protein JW793_10455 [Acidobacteria bacterium]|nr:hypothetical protein [Acidobacteriota bacterium]
MKDNFLLSTLAFVLGIIFVFSMTFLDKGKNGEHEQIARGDLNLLGWGMIIGASVYKSAKKRRLRKVEDSMRRKIFELGGLIIITLPLIFSSLNPYYPYGPIMTYVVPLWAWIAYIGVLKKTISSQADKADKDV